MKVHHVMKENDFEDCNINQTRYADLRYTSLHRLKIAVEANRKIFHDWFVESCVEFPHKFLLRIVYYSSTLASDPWESLMFTLSSRLLELLVNECLKAGARLFWPDEL